MRRLRKPARFEVVHRPYVFVRRAPSADAEPLGALPAGSAVEADAIRNGWVRTRCELARGGAAGAAAGSAGAGAGVSGWLLIDGAQLGLGPLLRRVDQGA